MANVFRSKEVYKHLKYDLHDRNTIVPVQGVYVSGEYRPPYYNNPVLMIYEMSSQPAKIDDFQDVSRSSDEDTVVKILDFSADFLQPSFDFYKTISESSGEDTVVKILDLSTTFIQPSFTYYNQKQTNMTPEPILRLSTLTSDRATVENYT